MTYLVFNTIYCKIELEKISKPKYWKPVTKYACNDYLWSQLQAGMGVTTFAKNFLQLFQKTCKKFYNKIKHKKRSWFYMQIELKSNGVVQLPTEVIKDLGLKAGIVLNCSIAAGQIILSPMNPLQALEPFPPAQWTITRVFWNFCTLLEQRDHSYSKS